LKKFKIKFEILLLIALSLILIINLKGNNLNSNKINCTECNRYTEISSSTSEFVRDDNSNLLYSYSNTSGTLTNNSIIDNVSLEGVYIDYITTNIELNDLEILNETFEIEDNEKSGNLNMTNTTLAASFQVYKNSVLKKLNIHLENDFLEIEITIRDSLSSKPNQILASHIITLTGINDYEIYFDNLLNPGIYFITIENDMADTLEWPYTYDNETGDNNDESYSYQYNSTTQDWDLIPVDLHANLTFAPEIESAEGLNLTINDKPVIGLVWKNNITYETHLQLHYKITANWNFLITSAIIEINFTKEINSEVYIKLNNHDGKILWNVSTQINYINNTFKTQYNLSILCDYVYNQTWSPIQVNGNGEELSFELWIDNDNFNHIKFTIDSVGPYVLIFKSNNIILNLKIKDEIGKIINGIPSNLSIELLYSIDFKLEIYNETTNTKIYEEMIHPIASNYDFDLLLQSNMLGPVYILAYFYNSTAGGFFNLSTEVTDKPICSLITPVNGSKYLYNEFKGPFLINVSFTNCLGHPLDLYFKYEIPSGSEIVRTYGGQIAFGFSLLDSDGFPLPIGEYNINFTVLESYNTYVLPLTFTYKFYIVNDLGNFTSDYSNYEIDSIADIDEYSDNKGKHFEQDLLFDHNETFLWIYLKVNVVNLGLYSELDTIKIKGNLFFLSNETYSIEGQISVSKVENFPEQLVEKQTYFRIEIHVPYTNFVYFNGTITLDRILIIKQTGQPIRVIQEKNLIFNVPTEQLIQPLWYESKFFSLIFIIILGILFGIIFLYSYISKYLIQKRKKELDELIDYYRDLQIVPEIEVYLANRIEKEEEKLNKIEAKLGKTEEVSSADKKFIEKQIINFLDISPYARKRFVIRGMKKLNYKLLILIFFPIFILLNLISHNLIEYYKYKLYMIEGYIPLISGIFIGSLSIISYLLAREIASIPRMTPIQFAKLITSTPGVYSAEVYSFAAYVQKNKLSLKGYFKYINIISFSVFGIISIVLSYYTPFNRYGITLSFGACAMALIVWLIYGIYISLFLSVNGISVLLVGISHFIITPNYMLSLLLLIYCIIYFIITIKLIDKNKAPIVNDLIFKRTKNPNITMLYFARLMMVENGIILMIILGILNISYLPGYIKTIDLDLVISFVPAIISWISLILPIRFRRNIVTKDGINFESLTTILKIEFNLILLLGFISSFFSLLSAFSHYYYPLAIDYGFGLYTCIFVYLLMRGNKIKAKDIKDIKRSFLAQSLQNEIEIGWNQEMSEEFLIAEYEESRYSLKFLKKYIKESYEDDKNVIKISELPNYIICTFYGESIENLVKSIEARAINQTAIGNYLIKGIFPLIFKEDLEFQYSQRFKNEKGKIYKEVDVIMTIPTIKQQLSYEIKSFTQTPKKLEKVLEFHLQDGHLKKYFNKKQIDYIVLIGVSYIHTEGNKENIIIKDLNERYPLNIPSAWAIHLIFIDYNILADHKNSPDRANDILDEITKHQSYLINKFNLKENNLRFNLIYDIIKVIKMMQKINELSIQNQELRKEYQKLRKEYQEQIEKLRKEYQEQIEELRKEIEELRKK